MMNRGKTKTINKGKTVSKDKKLEKITYKDIAERYNQMNRRAKEITKKEQSLLDRQVARQKDIYYYQQNLRPIVRHRDRTIRSLYRTDKIEIREKRLKEIKQLDKNIIRWKDKIRIAERDMELMEQQSDFHRFERQLL